MKTKIVVTVLVMSIGSLFINTSAHAQFVIKGIKCSDPSWIVHENSTSSTQIVTMQVVRDGCRPKFNSPSAGFYYILRSGSSTNSSLLERQAKRTASKSRTVPSGGQVEIIFTAIGGVRISGTFDYIISID